jgi:hypothetical protein
LVSEVVERGSSGSRPVNRDFVIFEVCATRQMKHR